MFNFYLLKYTKRNRYTTEKYKIFDVWTAEVASIPFNFHNVRLA